MAVSARLAALALVTAALGCGPPPPPKPWYEQLADDAKATGSAIAEPFRPLWAKASVEFAKLEVDAGRGEPGKLSVQCGSSCLLAHGFDEEEAMLCAAECTPSQAPPKGCSAEATPDDPTPACARWARGEADYRGRLAAFSEGVRATKDERQAAREEVDRRRREEAAQASAAEPPPSRTPAVASGGSGGISITHERHMPADEFGQACTSPNSSQPPDQDVPHTGTCRYGAVCYQKRCTINCSTDADCAGAGAGTCGWTDGATKFKICR